jgi:hypothetical protein
MQQVPATYTPSTAHLYPRDTGCPLPSSSHFCCIRFGPRRRRSLGRSAYSGKGEFVIGPKAKNGEQPSSSLEASFDAFLPWAGTEQRRATARTAASGTHQQRKLIHNGVPTGGNKYPFLVSTWVGTSLDVRRNFESINASPSIIHLHGFPFFIPRRTWLVRWRT